MPKVSVLLLTYKSNPEYLKKSLNSALNQSFRDLEVLIIDDGPGDHNDEIIDQFKERDKRVNIVKNKQRMGRLKCRNLGIKKAKGEYIAVLDSDDYWCDEKKLEKQVNFLENHSKWGAIGTAMVLIDDKDREIGKVKYPVLNEEIRKCMLASFQMAHPSVMFRKSVTAKIGGYSESKVLKFAEDYDFFLKVGRHYKLANLSDYCLKYRIHSGSGSTANEFKQRLTGILLTVKYFGQYPKGTSALVKKIVTMFLPRKIMDELIAKNKLFSKIYSKTTGINKQIK